MLLRWKQRRGVSLGWGDTVPYQTWFIWGTCGMSSVGGLTGVEAGAQRRGLAWMRYRFDCDYTWMVPRETGRLFGASKDSGKRAWD